MSPIFVSVSNIRASQTRRPVQPGRTAPMSNGSGGWSNIGEMILIGALKRRRLNAFTQYKVRLDDIDLHFIHVEGEGPNPCPLLLSHGWPGSILEFLKLIPMLTHPSQFGGDPADSFTVAIITRIRLVIFAEPAALRGGGNS
jgi:hypothetical protein